MAGAAMMEPKKEADVSVLQEQIRVLQKENEDLKKRLGESAPKELPLLLLAVLPNNFSAIRSAPFPANAPVLEKIALFRELFKGRDDVYAVRWENTQTGKKGYFPACEDPWAHKKGKSKVYLPLTDKVIEDHLSGKHVVGLFPLLQDNTCWLLACDFDKQGWDLDATAFISVCGQYGIPAYLEKSRSGNGGHVWIFGASGFGVGLPLK